MGIEIKINNQLIGKLINIEASSREYKDIHEIGGFKSMEINNTRPDLRDVE